MVKKNNGSRAPSLLIPIGFLHTGLEDKLADRGLPVHKTDDSFLDEPEYYDSLWKKIKHGGAPSQEELMRGLIGSLIRGDRKNGDIQVASSDTPQRIRVLRSIVSRIPSGDLEGILVEAISLAAEKGIDGIYEAGDRVVAEHVGKVSLSEVEVAEYPLVKVVKLVH